MSNAKQRWRRKADQVLSTLCTVAWRRDGLRFGQILLFAMSVPLLMRLKLPRLSRLLDARQCDSLPNE